MTNIRVAGIAGSLRKASFNRGLLRAAVALAPSGMTLETEEIADIPFYDGDVEAAGIPASVAALASRIRAADALLIVTPEYNYSIPGVLKNALDWLSRVPQSPLSSKPAAILSASPGMMGGARAQYQLRQILNGCGLLLIGRPEVFVMNARDKFDPQGELTDGKTREKVGELLVALRDWTLRLGQSPRS